MTWSPAQEADTLCHGTQHTPGLGVREAEGGLGVGDGGAGQPATPPQ